MLETDEAWRPDTGPERGWRQKWGQGRWEERLARYLHDLWLPGEEMGREAHEIRYIWVGVGEGALETTKYLPEPDEFR